MNLQMISSIATVCGIAIVAGAILYGCDQAGRRYQASMSECIAAGGTWVPIGNGAGNYSAACVGSRR